MSKATYDGAFDAAFWAAVTTRIPTRQTSRSWALAAQYSGAVLMDRLLPLLNVCRSSGSMSRAVNPNLRLQASEPLKVRSAGLLILSLTLGSQALLHIARSRPFLQTVHLDLVANFEGRQGNKGGLQLGHEVIRLAG